MFHHLSLEDIVIIRIDFDDFVWQSDFMGNILPIEVLVSYLDKDIADLDFPLDDSEFVFAEDVCPDVG